MNPDKLENLFFSDEFSAVDAHEQLVKKPSAISLLILYGSKLILVAFQTIIAKVNTGGIKNIVSKNCRMNQL
jgi:hypothetical protein|tara:strand:+ start:3748 stop:3963 length:216 start_codon:yes stop_codon:yes gene_type:complete